MGFTTPFYRNGSRDSERAVIQLLTGCPGIGCREFGSMLILHTAQRAVKAYHLVYVMNLAASFSTLTMNGEKILTGPGARRKGILRGRWHHQHTLQ